ncbi:alkylhydroperoxidase family enzyme [Paraburkholderia sp. GAS334]
MSRIGVPAVESATGATAEVYAEVKKAAGSVPNLFVALGALAPQVLKSVLNAEGVLGASTLSKQEVETIKLAVSELTGCDYCVAAHTRVTATRNWWRSRWPSR